jgi:type IV secretion system protein VirB3
MSKQEYTIEVDDLALGLTRPSMVFGVTITVAFSNLMIAALSYIYTRSFYLIFLVAIFHLIATQLSVKEPRFLDLRFRQFTLTPPVLNYNFWGKCNSYAPE